jgi:alanyl-tRNA synthetase
MRNHTATHLLHTALRKTLGEHVNQSGSYVGPEKLRFDYSHFQPMTPAEINMVERMVNGAILKGVDVSTHEDNLENAKKSGAMAIFGEKYEDKVRVVSVGELSKELCGGTHVENSSQIGPFMITSETALASGVRRIEAVTGFDAVEMMLGQKKTFEKLEKITGRKMPEITEAVEDILNRLNELQKENKKLKANQFSGGSTTVGSEVKIGKYILRYHDFENIDLEAIEGWVDTVKGQPGMIVAVAIARVNGKRTILVSSSGEVKKHIGNLSKEVLQRFGARGGGKPNFARGSLPDDLEAQQVFDAFIEKLKSI